MSQHWEEPPEEDGLTLGPEETLQREIEKSKTLKVEKDDLAQKNHLLKARLTALGSPPVTPEKVSVLSRNILISALFLCFLTLLWFIIRD
jgi:hypothetical protein